MLNPVSKRKLYVFVLQLFTRILRYSFLWYTRYDYFCYDVKSHAA